MIENELEPHELLNVPHRGEVLFCRVGPEIVAGEMLAGVSIKAQFHCSSEGKSCLVTNVATAVALAGEEALTCHLCGKQAGHCNFVLLPSGG